MRDLFSPTDEPLRTLPNEILVIISEKYHDLLVDDRLGYWRMTKLLIKLASVSSRWEDVLGLTRFRTVETEIHEHTQQGLVSGRSNVVYTWNAKYIKSRKQFMVEHVCTRQFQPYGQTKVRSVSQTSSTMYLPDVVSKNQSIAGLFVMAMTMAGIAVAIWKGCTTFATT